MLKTPHHFQAWLLYFHVTVEVMMAEISSIKDGRITVMEYLPTPTYVYITLTEEKALKMIKDLTKYLDGVKDGSKKQV